MGVLYEWEYRDLFLIAKAFKELTNRVGASPLLKIAHKRNKAKTNKKEEYSR